MSATVNSTVTAALISTVKPRVSISVVDPVATVEYTLPVAAIDYILLAVSAELDPLNKNPFIADAFVMTDARVIAFAKALADSSAVSDSSRTAFNKALSDAATISEQILVALDIVRSYADSINTSDAKVLSVGKNLADQALAQDAILSQAFDKAVSDGVAMNDLADVGDGFEFQFEASFTNVAIATEDLIRDLAKAISDQANIVEQLAIAFTPEDKTDSFSVADDSTLEYGKNADDQVESTDQVNQIDSGKGLDETLVIQEALTKDFSAAFFDSVAIADIIDVTRELSEEDSTSTTDDLSFLFDSFLDEVVLVGDSVALDYAASKTETASMSDSSYWDFDKNPSDTPLLSDDLNYDMTQSLSDGVGMNDAMGFGFTYTTSFSNVATVADSVSLNPSPGISDSVTPDDSGSLRSQGYCDFTYFAEDYVGESRTFT